MKMCLTIPGQELKEDVNAKKRIKLNIILLQKNIFKLEQITNLTGLLIKRKSRMGRPNLNKANAKIFRELGAFHKMI